MDLKKVTNGVKNYLVDTTGLLLASTPFYVEMEILASGMSSATSFESRFKDSCLAYAGAYAGLGIVYAKGRDFSKKIFKIDEQSAAKKHNIHDSIYNAAFNIAFSVPLYLSSGADLEQTAKGALEATLLGLASGPINGFSIDTFRDFLGTKKSQRLPKVVQNVRSKTKKLLAAGLIATMIGATAGVYTIKDKYFSNSQTQEQRQEISPLEEKVLELPMNK